MNFSTVPPNPSISARRRLWYGRIVASTSSGSAASEREVNPTRSQKSTDTTLRSVARSWRDAVRALAHSLQNLAPSGFSVPQFGHSMAASLGRRSVPR